MQGVYYELKSQRMSIWIAEHGKFRRNYESSLQNFLNSLWECQPSKHLGILINSYSWVLIRWVPSWNFNHCIWSACCIAELRTKFLEYSLRWTISSQNGMEHWIQLKEPLVKEGCSFYFFTQYSFKLNFNYKLDLKSNLFS